MSEIGGARRRGVARVGEIGVARRCSSAPVSEVGARVVCRSAPVSAIRAALPPPLAPLSAIGPALPPPLAPLSAIGAALPPQVAPVTDIAAIPSAEAVPVTLTRPLLLDDPAHRRRVLDFQRRPLRGGRIATRIFRVAAGEVEGEGLRVSAARRCSGRGGADVVAGNRVGEWAPGGATSNQPLVWSHRVEQLKRRIVVSLEG
jgi:hypothetical protein